MQREITEPAWSTRNRDARIYCGDARNALRLIASESIQCCVTSPPYWGLRDYGHDGQLGLEKTPEEYVAKMVDVFHEVRRVLRGDGTLWLNLGDSYVGGSRDHNSFRRDRAHVQSPFQKTPEGLKPKDLVGIPWRVAFALQADGWYLRQDIIWAKPNPMPESVTDRCTKSHEYIFLLAKSARYYYDHEAVKESATPQTRTGVIGYKCPKDTGGYARDGQKSSEKSTLNSASGDRRNRRSVWTISTKPYSDAHFATFPPDLIEPCILAGCPEGGVVLDPFNGSGTTGAACIKHGRQYVGIELKPEYIELSKQRIGESERKFSTPLFSEIPKGTP